MGCDRDITKDAGDDSKLASTSKFSSSTLKPPMRDPNSDWRRRSVDVGGLALALKTASLGDEQIETGMGWGSWGGYSEQEESEPSGTMYAELLSDMYTQTQTSVNQPILSPPPEISPETRTRLIDILDRWHFEPHKLPDAELLACTLLLFEALFRIKGMEDTVGISLDQLSHFLAHLRQAYRAANSYHNFQHALDVFQATYIYLRSAGAVPSVSILHTPKSETQGQWCPSDAIRSSWAGILRKEDIFALCVAAVGHDVGHPGFNNMFMKNAQAPLSQVYDHKSALEQMHCAFLLPLMKRHGFGHLLGQSSISISFKRLLLDTVLATDMGVHANFMQRFSHLMEDPQKFDVTQARTLICQALIKCADISNPSRPHMVSQHWSSALAAEWASQALLERQLCLPVSVQDSSDPMVEANGQISFITIFVLPLLEITVLAIPEMMCFAEQCAKNRQLWRARIVDLQKDPDESQKITTEGCDSAEVNDPNDPYAQSSDQTLLPKNQKQDLHTIFPLSLPPHFFPPRERTTSGCGSVVGEAIELERHQYNEVYIDDVELEKGDNSNSIKIHAAVLGLNEVSSRPTSPSPYQFSSYEFPSGTTISDFRSKIERPPCPLSGSPHFSPQEQKHTLPSITTRGSVLSPECSPTTSVTEVSSPRTPHSHTSSVASAPGSAYTPSISSGLSVHVADTPSIRSAYKLSVRKKKSFHRNSWTPSLTGGSSTPVPSIPLAAGPTRSPLVSSSLSKPPDTAG